MIGLNLNTGTNKMLFHTESGSIYEVNADKKSIRRLSNAAGNQATERQTNGWRTYEDISPIKIGNQVLIVWPKQTTPLFPGSPDSAVPSTLTSHITKIE
jgi:hypothetical protein